MFVCMVGGKSVFRNAVAAPLGLKTLSVLASQDPTRQESSTQTSSVRIGSVNVRISRGLTVEAVVVGVGEVENRVLAHLDPAVGVLLREWVGCIGMLIVAQDLA
jgi:hypothetical protein